MASLTLRSIKGSPLTLAEVDTNFTNLNTELGTKLTATSYTAADILSKLLTVDGASSGLDADLVDGLSPTSSNVGNSLVSRNSSGNFTAGIITASLVGNVAGDIYASDGITRILDNGTGANATFTGNVTGNVTGTLTGNASTATTLANTRSISATGDATWTINFNGSANSTAALTLANTGVTAGTYTKVTVDAKGRTTAGASLSSADITTILGYTPLSTTGKAADANLLDGYDSALTATANTVAVRDSSGDITANLFKGTATAARYADLAEKYTTDKEYQVGTVVTISSDDEAECTATVSIGQRAIGVISQNPAFLMNAESEGQAVALKGRVPIRVIGPIRKGQTLIAAEDGCAISGDVNVIAIALSTNLDINEKLVEGFIV